MTVFVNIIFVMLGNDLQIARKSEELKLRELGTLVNIDQTLVSRFERGERLSTAGQLVSKHTLDELPKLRDSFCPALLSKYARPADAGCSHFQHHFRTKIPATFPTQYT